MRTLILLLLCFFAFVCEGKVDYKDFKIPEFEKLFPETWDPKAPFSIRLMEDVLDRGQIAGELVRYFRKHMPKPWVKPDTSVSSTSKMPSHNQSGEQIKDDNTSATPVDYAVQILYKTGLLIKFDGLQDFQIVGEETIKDKDDPMVKKALTLLEEVFAEMKQNPIDFSVYKNFRDNFLRKIMEEGLNDEQMKQLILTLTVLDVLIHIDPVDATGELIRRLFENFKAACTVVGIQVKTPEILKGKAVYKAFAGMVHEHFAKELNPLFEMYEGRTSCAFANNFDAYPMPDGFIPPQRGQVLPINAEMFTVSQLMQGPPDMFATMQILENSVTKTNYFEEKNLVRLGGAAKKILEVFYNPNVAAAMFPISHLNPWDMSGTEKMVELLGGMLADIKGEPYKHTIPDGTTPQRLANGLIVVKNASEFKKWQGIANLTWQAAKDQLVTAADAWIRAEGTARQKKAFYELLHSYKERLDTSKDLKVNRIVNALLHVKAVVSANASMTTEDPYMLALTETFTAWEKAISNVGRAVLGVPSAHWARDTVKDYSLKKVIDSELERKLKTTADESVTECELKLQKALETVQDTDKKLNFLLQSFPSGSDPIGLNEFYLKSEKEWKTAEEDETEKKRAYDSQREVFSTKYGVKFEYFPTQIIVENQS